MITSLAFVLILLPFSIVAYAMAPPFLRSGVLLVLSLLFCFLAQPWSVPLLAFVVVTDYAAINLMERYDQDPKKRKGCFLAALIKDLLVLVVAYSLVEITDIPLPFGAMIYTLSSLSCVMDVYKRHSPYERNLVDFGLLCVFFPKLYAGPLVSYNMWMPHIKDLRQKKDGNLLDMEALIDGGSQLVFGLCKVVILGDTAAQLYSALNSFPDDRATVLSTWSMVVCLAFSLYFRLVGYCDIAAGLGKMFHLPLPGNFDHPFQAQSVENFFERFNSTVSGFIRKYVYVNLDEDRHGALSDSVNLLVVGLLMGLYFGVRVNYILWGAYLALFIVLERYVFKDVIRAIPTFFMRIITFCIVMTSFAIFGGETVADTFAIVGRMLGRNLAFLNSATLYLLRSNWLLLLLCLFFSLGFTDNLLRWIRKRLPKAISLGLLAVISAVILVVTIAFMV